MKLSDQERRELSAFPIVGGLLFVFGVILFVVGTGSVAYYLNFFDTSVETGKGDFVYNIGLMQERQNGLMLGAIGAVVGLCLVLYGQRRAVQERAEAEQQMAAQDTRRTLLQERDLLETQMLAEKAQRVDSTVGAVASSSPIGLSAPVSRDERECPHCAEPILARAKLCKHCGRDVSA